MDVQPVHTVLLLLKQCDVLFTLKHRYVKYYIYICFVSRCYWSTDILSYFVGKCNELSFLSC